MSEESPTEKLARLILDPRSTRWDYAFRDLPKHYHDLAKGLQVYGDQRARQEAEEMRSTFEREFAGWELSETNRRRIRQAIRSLPLPPDLGERK